MSVIGDGQVRNVSRFGPEPGPRELDAIGQSKELDEIIRAAYSRLRKPLWFWEMTP
jgi:hypothetical protein